MPYIPGVVQKPSKDIVNPTSLDEAIKMCEKLVYKQAHKWTRNHYQDRDDIIQEGFMGVITAWEKFHDTDYEKNGYRFTSYAWMWIRAMMKAYAEKNWKYKNNTNDYQDLSERPDIGNDSYELDENMIDLALRVGKMSEEDQKIFVLRKQGFTFSEIAEETGAQNLHKVRNRFLELCEQF